MKTKFNSKQHWINTVNDWFNSSKKSDNGHFDYMFRRGDIDLDLELSKMSIAQLKIICKMAALQYSRGHKDYRDQSASFSVTEAKQAHQAELEANRSELDKEDNRSKFTLIKGGVK